MSVNNNNAKVDDKLILTADIVECLSVCVSVSTFLAFHSSRMSEQSRLRDNTIAVFRSLNSCIIQRSEIITYCLQYNIIIYIIPLDFSVPKNVPSMLRLMMHAELSIADN